MKLDENEIKRVQEQTKATLAIEGIKPSDGAIKINVEYLKGRIDSKEAIEKIINLHLGEWRNENYINSKKK